MPQINHLGAWPVLLLLLIIPLLHRWWLKRGSPARIQFSLPFDRSILTSNPLKLKLGIRYLALLFLVLALSRPQTALHEQQKNISGIDIMLVLDVSASMNAEDLGERSRFEIAKDVLKDFVSGRKNDRIGFLIFSGEPFTMAPPTLDYSLILDAIKSARIGELKDGTAIGDGLSLAVNRLRNSKAKNKVIVLMTDGDNNLGQVDPATAGDLALGYGIKVYTIAIGREGRVRLPIRTDGPFGNVITSYQWMDNTLNPELLKQIAAKSNGKFYRVTDENTLSQVFKEIDSLEKTDMNVKEKVKYTEHYQGALKISLLLLLLEQVLVFGIWRLAL